MTSGRMLIYFLAAAILLMSCAAAPETPGFTGPQKEFMAGYLKIISPDEDAEKYFAGISILEIPENAGYADALNTFVEKNPELAAKTAGILFERAAAEWLIYERAYNPNAEKEYIRAALKHLEFAGRDFAMAMNISGILEKSHPETVEFFKIQKGNSFDTLEIPGK